jgi:DNA modification methylase
VTYAILFAGDCLESMRALPENSIDSVVCDPPYELVSITKRFGKQGSAPAKQGTDGAFARASRGFMNQLWDGTGISYNPETWYEVLRVLKPGGHMLCFGGSKSFHRIAVAIEDAGFELRDTLMWLYGTGFPKSHDVSKGIDKMLGAEREVISVGKALKRMVPGADQIKTGTWIKDSSRMYEPTETIPGSPEAAQWDGWGTALKPSFEPIILARKSLDGTVAANTLKWGCGGINIDACRVEGRERTDYGLKTAIRSHGAVYGQPSENADFDATKGRFPANTLHDGSDEVLEAFPNGEHRFFYSAKASAAERVGTKHPTVKPQNLMAYLCKLITPPGGMVLDPFAGSGSTGMSAVREGFNVILCEREEEYCRDIQTRVPGIKLMRKKVVA